MNKSRAPPRNILMWTWIRKTVRTKALHLVSPSWFGWLQDNFLAEAKTERVKRNSKLVKVSSKKKSVKSTRFKHIVMNVWSIATQKLQTGRCTLQGAKGVNHLTTVRVWDLPNFLLTLQGLGGGWVRGGIDSTPTYIFLHCFWIAFPLTMRLCDFS